MMMIMMNYSNCDYDDYIMIMITNEKIMIIWP